MNKFKRGLAAVGILSFVAFGAGCGISTATDETKVHVGAGPFEDAKFKDCIKPSTNNNSITNDNYFAYPTGSERDYDATGQEGADAKAFTVVSKDNAEMAIPVVIRFNLNGDCKVLNQFHQKYGARYAAYLDDDGKTSPGWTLMLRKLMGDPVDSTLDEISKNYTGRDLYTQAGAQNELQTTLQKNIEKIVNTNARGEFFDNFTVLVKKPQPTDETFKKALSEEQSAVATAQSAEAKARATKVQAEAETATARAEAAKKQAEINGFRLPGMTAEQALRAYNEARAIEQGLNPYQPTYKVSDTK